MHKITTDLEALADYTHYMRWYDDPTSIYEEASRCTIPSDLGYQPEDFQAARTFTAIMDRIERAGRHFLAEYMAFVNRTRAEIRARKDAGEVFTDAEVGEDFQFALQALQAAAGAARISFITETDEVPTNLDLRACALADNQFNWYKDWRTALRHAAVGESPYAFGYDDAQITAAHAAQDCLEAIRLAKPDVYDAYIEALSARHREVAEELNAGPVSLERDLEQGRLARRMFNDACDQAGVAAPVAIITPEMEAQIEAAMNPISERWTPERLARVEKMLEASGL